MTQFNFVTFNNWTCKVKLHKYADNKRTCIRLVDHKTREPIATASINLPKIKMEEGEVAIKDLRENTGMMESLLRAGIVYQPHRSVISGMEMYEICKLGPTPSPDEETYQWLVAIGEIEPQDFRCITPTELDNWF